MFTNAPDWAFDLGVRGQKVADSDPRAIFSCDQKCRPQPLQHKASGPKPVLETIFQLAEITIRFSREDRRTRLKAKSQWTKAAAAKNESLLSPKMPFKHASDLASKVREGQPARRSSSSQATRNLHGGQASRQPKIYLVVTPRAESISEL